MPTSPEDLVAAGPWQTGTPAEQGNYLVQYQKQAHNEHIQFGVFRYFENTGWHLTTGDEMIIRYAPIHRPK
jgi:hypothetical protein